MKAHSRKTGKPTIVDIARAVGVSHSTVSRALNGSSAISQETTERIMAVARDLNYVANPQARSLAGGRTYLIGVLIHGFSLGFQAELLDGIQSGVMDSDFNLMLYTTQDKWDDAAYASLGIDNLVDGLVIVSPDVSHAYIESLRQRQFPYVLVQGPSPQLPGTYIGVENIEACRAGVAYLYNLGHRRIGYIAGKMNGNSAPERLTGYWLGLEDVGLPVDETLIREGDYSQSDGFQQALALLDLPQPPTAIFTANDGAAFGVMEAIRDRGLRIPADVSVLGFGNTVQSATVTPPLTTIDQRMGDMGRMAVEMLLDYIADRELADQQVRLDAPLVIRDTCCPPSRTG